MSRRVYLAPSLLSADPMNMERSISALEGAHDWLHVDVMDGHFVLNITFGPSFVKGLRERFPMRSWTSISWCSIRPASRRFYRRGADILTIHVETSAICTGPCRASGTRGPGRGYP